ncbi:MAG: glycosyltransferase family 39 protein [Chloroflexi bacterium]|nr:glycosyltransferase family 39 protein [Chloroflexota bacterium]
MGQQQRWAILISAAFVILALAYNFANPPFEAVDEIRHFRYVRYLTLNHALPPVSAESSRELQAHHPPLYYILAALITSPIQSDAGPDYTPPVNPFWGFRYFEPSTDNKNQYLHSPDERWQFSGATLIVYLGRWLSMLFGLGAVLMAYRLSRTVFPDRPALALGAMAFVAFNPMFLHGSASLNNDTAVAFFGSWAIVESAAIAQFGPTNRRGLALGIALGLGILSKASALPLILAAAAAFVAASLRHERHCFKYSLLTVSLFTALTGWWFARNYLQTGDIMGLRDYQSAWAGDADRARLIREALSGLPYAWTTFWARFDYGQIVLPDWAYQGLAALCMLAVIGLTRARREFRSPGLLIVALAVLVSLAGWGVLMITIPATANARLVFQIFPALGLLFVLGWQELLTPRHEDTRPPRKISSTGFNAKSQGRKENRLMPWRLCAFALNLSCPSRESRRIFVSLSLSAFVFLFALVALFGYLAPAFAYPRVAASLPKDTTLASANFEGAAEIVGYRVSADKVQPGDGVGVTVYWRPLSQTTAPLQVFVHLVNSEGIIVAQRDTYPGLGKAITTTWRVGQILADTYRVFIPDTAYAPETLTVRVGLWNPDENRPLIANDSDTLEVGALALQSRVGTVPNPTSINFANKMALRGYELDARILKPGNTILLTTYWQPVAPEADYWAYAHIVGADGRIWAIADSIIVPPITGWPLGEVRSETRQIVLASDTPPGQYTIEFGLTKILNPGQDRLSVLADDGHEVGDHIELAKIRVAP